MTGVSYVLPFVIAGGGLVAVAITWWARRWPSLGTGWRRG
jgi:fructose-specific phosphotransferase system IIC component